MSTRLMNLIRSDDKVLRRSQIISLYTHGVKIPQRVCALLGEHRMTDAPPPRTWKRSRIRIAASAPAGRRRFTSEMMLTAPSRPRRHRAFCRDRSPSP